MLHGAQKPIFDLEFRLPSACADALADGEADIGIVPAIEVERLGLDIIPGVGIACRGEVRSILLISKVPPERVRTLATDTSSRSSNMLARVILERGYEAHPALEPCRPALSEMLAHADAAVMIGDPALRLEIESLPYTCLDLGAEWLAFSGLPMVFAVWACRPGLDTAALAPAFLDCWRFGMANLEEIVRTEAPLRGLPEERAREYLSRRIVFEIGEQEREGMRAFVEYAHTLSAAGMHA